MFATKIQRKFINPCFSLCRKINSQYVMTSENNGVREITLCHEKTKNSLSLDMMNNLIEAINTNKDDVSLRAIVLSAKGNVFSAGHNLKEFQSSAGVSQHQLILEKATELMKSIVQSPVPVIAKVDGIATAAGCQLVATCDIIVCTVPSEFSTPGANFGIFCSTPGIAIGRQMPKSRAMYMLLTGDSLTGKEAYESGLVTTVVPKGLLNREVERITDSIKLKSRSVISLGKQFYYKQIELSLLDAYKLGEQIMVENINAADGQEGIRSFVEKRKAVWNHE